MKSSVGSARMPAPTLRTEGIVLARTGAGDTHQRLTVLSAQHGRLICLQRLSKKSLMQRADLFDSAELLLEGPKANGFYFVKEYALQTRREGIGRSYETLRCASEFAEILDRNSQNAADIPPLLRLARTAFAAWEKNLRPEAALFKALCLLAQNEGYPLREDFLAQLNDRQRAAALDILRQPLDKQSIPPAQVDPLLTLLRRWIKGYTDIWIP